MVRGEQETNLAVHREDAALGGKAQHCRGTGAAPDRALRAQTRGGRSGRKCHGKYTRRDRRTESVTDAGRHVGSLTLGAGAGAECP